MLVSGVIKTASQRGGMNNSAIMAKGGKGGSGKGGGSNPPKK